MKKLIVVGSLLGLSSLAFASGMAPMPAPVMNYFDGAYVGVGVGVQHTTGDIKNTGENAVGVLGDVNFAGRDAQEISILRRTIDIPALPPIKTPFNVHAGNTLTTDNDSGVTEPNGNIFAGYGKTYNNIYVGGEVFGRYTSSEMDNTSDRGLNVFVMKHQPISNVHDSIEVSTDWSYGGALRLGYLFTPKTMVYLLAGVEVSKFDNDVDHNVNVLGHDVPVFANDYDFNETRVGFMPGIGMETMITDKLSLRAEYTYVDYGSYTGSNNIHRQSGTTTIGDQAGDHLNIAAYTDTNSKYEVDPSRGLFTLALAYHFNGI